MDSNTNEILENISKEYLEDLLKEIHHDVILVAAKNLRDTEKVTLAVKDGWLEGQQWVDEFNILANETAHALDGYYARIENDFNKIFAEWEKFQVENDVNK